MAYSCQKDESDSNDNKKDTLKDGLVGYYPFNGNAKDESGNANDGNVIGPILCNDKSGVSQSAYIFFTSHQDRIECNEDPIGDDETVSVSVMINPYARSYSNSVDDIEYIISTGSQTNSIGYYIYWDKGNIGLGRKTQSFCFDTVLYTNYQHNEWYNIVYMYNNDNKSVNLYVNGECIMTGLAKEKETTNNQFNKLVIGMPNNVEGTFLYSFNGIIDEVRIYNRILTAYEIKKLNN